MNGIDIRLDLGTREGQHAISRQDTGDGRLVHAGRQAIPAVEFAGDVAVVILVRDRRKRGGSVRNIVLHHFLVILHLS